MLSDYTVAFSYIRHHREMYQNVPERCKSAVRLYHLVRDVMIVWGIISFSRIHRPVQAEFILHVIHQAQSLEAHLNILHQSCLRIHAILYSNMYVVLSHIKFCLYGMVLYARSVRVRHAPILCYRVPACRIRIDIVQIVSIVTDPFIFPQIFAIIPRLGCDLQFLRHTLIIFLDDSCPCKMLNIGIDIYAVAEMLCNEITRTCQRNHITVFCRIHKDLTCIISTNLLLKSAFNRRTDDLV